MPTRDINAVLAEHAPAWMARDGVAGVAVGATDDGTPCLLILIAHDDDELRASLPQQVDGHPVRIEVSGEFRPY